MKIFSRPGGDNQVLTRLQIAGWLFVVLCIGVGWKVFWLLQGVFPFNADEAITGLMARHILQGARPVFFYGQSYMGSLDAFLVAGLFRVFGESVLCIRILQIFLYSCTIIMTAALGKSIANSWETGLLAALFLAVPVVNITLYSTVSLGGYGEALLLSNGAFLCASVLHNRLTEGNPLRKTDWVLVGLLGAITGLGFWIFGITLIATVPAVILTITAMVRVRKTNQINLIVVMFTFLLFFFVGSFPWWVNSLQKGIVPLIGELTGSAVSIEGGNWFSRTALHLFYFVFLGLPVIFGFRPPWEFRWLVLPLIPIVLGIWGFAFWQFSKLLRVESRTTRLNWMMLVGSVCLLTAGFLLTPFGLDPSGRYFLLLVVPLSLMLARVLTSIIKQNWIQCSLVLFLLVYHAAGTWQSAWKNPPGLTTQFDAVTWIDHHYDEELIQFLRHTGETRGYTNYWVSYPLAFLSNEELVFSPRLPYHQDLRYTTRDDRYPDYTQAVRASDKTAYITTFNPALDEKLQQKFTQLNITWKVKLIGDYRIYYQLSRPVHLEEIDLGFDNPNKANK